MRYGSNCRSAYFGDATSGRRWNVSKYSVGRILDFCCLTFRYDRPRDKSRGQSHLLIVDAQLEICILIKKVYWSFKKFQHG